MKEIEKIKINMYITRNVEKHQIPTIEISVLCLCEHVCSLHLLNAACSVTAATASPSDPSDPLFPARRYRRSQAVRIRS